MSTTSTAERLRADIDSGRTGGKVAASDPAAAPLGTDDEAAGRAPSRDAVRLARHHEVVHPEAQPEDRRFGSVMVYGALVTVLSLLLVGLVLFFRGMP